jgi:hypothetical protein
MTSLLDPALVFFMPQIRFSALTETDGAKLCLSKRYNYVLGRGFEAAYGC